MKKSLAIAASMLLAASTSLFAQSANRDHLGFYSIPGFPYCHMDNKLQTYSVVTDHIVPIDPNGPKKHIKSNIYLSYKTAVSSPDGADIVISVDDDFEKYDYDKITFHDAAKPRPKPKKETKQTTTINMPFLNWLLSDNSSTTTTTTTTTQAPAGPLWVAKGKKEVGFSVEVKTKEGIVFTDTIYYMQEFESGEVSSKSTAKDQVINKMKAFNLSSQLKAYQPFLAKVVGATPLTTVNFNGFGVRVKKKCPNDYTDINEALANFKEAYDFLKQRQWEIDEFKEMAAPSVKVWEESIKNANVKDPNAKVNKEVAAAMYYNMAVYSALIRDFNASYEYFKKADRTDLGFSDALQMSKMAQTWINAQEAYDQMMAE